MGCILNAILFIFLFGFIVLIYVGTTMWTQIRQMRDLFRGRTSRQSGGRTFRGFRSGGKSRSGGRTANPDQTNPQKNKIFSKGQGEYVDFEEVP